MTARLTFLGARSHGAQRVVKNIDNRGIAQVAKLSGAPDAKASGVERHVRTCDRVEAKRCIPFYAEATGKLHYALHYAAANDDIFQMTEAQ